MFVIFCQLFIQPFSIHKFFLRKQWKQSISFVKGKIDKNNIYIFKLDSTSVSKTHMTDKCMCWSLRKM